MPTLKKFIIKLDTEKQKDHTEAGAMKKQKGL